MGAIGSGVFENDDALDFLGDLEEASATEREDLVLRALDGVLLNDGYVDAPDMSVAVAAAGSVGAVLNPAMANGEPYLPLWLDADAFEASGELIEKSRRVLRRAVRSQDNEWWELWDEAELAHEVQEACARALSWLGDRDD